MPDRAAVVVGWLGAFFEEVLGRNSDLACAQAFAKDSVANGRYLVVFSKLAAARDAIGLTQFHSTCHARPCGSRVRPVQSAVPAQ